MSHLKKGFTLFQKGVFNIHFQELEAAVISYENEVSCTVGIFNVGVVKGEVEVPLEDGVYQNILYPNQVKGVENKKDCFIR